MCGVQPLGCARLFVALWTVACRTLSSGLTVLLDLLFSIILSLDFLQIIEHWELTSPTILLLNYFARVSFLLWLFGGCLLLGAYRFIITLSPD